MNVPRAARTAFHIPAQERIVFGVPAGEAVVAEAERVGAKRVFVTSTRSLAQKEDGPLQRMEKALGSRHVGTYAAISSHSPREDVVAGAKAAREAKADLLVAVGGGSVIDATKGMLLCLWMGLDSPEAMEPYCLGFERTKTRTGAAGRSDPHDRGVDHAIGLRVHRERRHHPVGHQHQAIVPPPPVRAAHGGARSGLPRSTRPTGCCSAPASARSTTRSRTTATPRRTWRPRRSRCRASSCSTARCRPSRGTRGDLAPRLEAQIGMWQAIAPSAVGRADGRQPRHRLCAGRHLRRRARAHLLRDAARGAEVERGRQRRAAEGAVGGDGRAGPAGQRSRRASWWRASTSPPRCGRSASSARTSTRSRAARSAISPCSSTRARSRRPTTSRRSWSSPGELESQTASLVGTTYHQGHASGCSEEPARRPTDPLSVVNG